MNFQEQSILYMDQLAGRKRNPVKKATLHAYRSYLSNWILPELGKLPLSKVENGAMKALVGRMVQSGRSASTIAGVTNCVKEVVASSTDSDGNQLHPRKWNTDFIDAPVITGQKAPIITQLEANRAISASYGQYRALLALLAGSGLRISEALALKKAPCPNCSYYDRDRAVLVVNTQLYKGSMQSPKTAAGIREIDLDPALNEYLKSYAGATYGDSLFTMSIDSAYRMAEKLNVPGFHSFRRFRATHLENQNVPRGIFKFWMGHAGEDISDRYVKVGAEIQSRKEWAEKAGLGFELPQ